MKYLKVFTDFAEKMELLGDAERGRLFTAMLLYAETGTVSELKGNERFLWKTAKAEIDREAEVYKRKAEGAAKARKHISSDFNLINSDISSKNLISEQDKDKDKEKEKENILLTKNNKAPVRHKYGEYQNVLLSDDELAKLKAEFPGDYKERIERLSAYIAQSGKVYKSHLATIRNWARRDAPAADPAKAKQAAPTSADMEHMADVLARIKGGA